MKLVDDCPRRTAFYKVMERMNYTSKAWWLEVLESWSCAFIEAKGKVAGVKEIWDQRVATSDDLAQAWRTAEGLMEVATNHDDLQMLGLMLKRHYEEFKDRIK